jgi:hypothetical protein
MSERGVSYCEQPLFGSSPCCHLSSPFVFVSICYENDHFKSSLLFLLASLYPILYSSLCHTISSPNLISTRRPNLNPNPALQLKLKLKFEPNLNRHPGERNLQLRRRIAQPL